MNAQTEIAELLPASIADLTDVIGLPAVLDLMKAYGGTELWIPAKLAHNHPLIDAIGPEAAQTLVEYAGTEKISVPRGTGIEREWRNQGIRRDRTHGAKIDELALRYKLTRRHIISILNANPADDRQQDLFG